MIDREFRAAPGLAFRFAGLPASLRAEIDRYLGDLDPGARAGDRVLTIASGSPPPGSRGARVLDRDGLVVSRAGASTLFGTARITGWCDGSSGRGGIEAAQPTAAEAREWVGLALAPLLIELAEPAGWLGLHAAAVAVAGRAILLPGPSGAGKSTTFRNCGRAGFEVLSDDLVWLRETRDGGFDLFPFPRGFAELDGEETVPPPSVACARLTAIVFPSIVDRAESRVEKTSSGEALDVLLAESGFLGPPPAAGRRFGALVRLAGSVPVHRLEAGRRPEDVPALLEPIARQVRSS